MSLDSGLKAIIEKAFVSVFNRINLKTEVNKDYNKTLIDISQKYSSWAVSNYGTFPLFGVNRTAHVDDLHVKLKYTGIIDREKFKSIEQIEEEVLANQLEENIIEQSGYDIIEALDNAYITVEYDAENSTRKKRASEKNIFQNVALLGVAGSGKTTTMKYLALLAARGRKLRGKERFPFYISLRDITIKHDCIVKTMAKFFSGFDMEYPLELVNKFIREGAALILIDGIDELSESQQKTVLSEVDSLQRMPSASNSDKSIIVVSGRPYSLYRGLNGFMKFDVLPFNDIDKYQFVVNWYKHVDINRGERLNQKLKNSKSIRDIGSNPLLLSIICALDYNEYDIPKRLDDLFEQCIQGLLGKWDAFRDISRKTILGDISARKKASIVSTLAAFTFIKSKIVFTNNDQSVKTACNFAQRYMANTELEPSLFLRSLYNDFGILVERTQNTYSFSHLSFHEYLTGYWLLMVRKEMEFISSFKRIQPRWIYVIEYLARNLDSSAFEFLSVLTNKIDYRQRAQIKTVCSIITDSETVITAVERKKLALMIAQWINYHLRGIKSNYRIVNDTLFVVIDLEHDSEKFRDHLNCINDIGHALNAVFNGSYKEVVAFSSSQELMSDSLVFDVNVSMRGHDITTVVLN